MIWEGKQGGRINFLPRAIWFETEKCMQPIGGKITALFTARSPINRNPADNGVADWSVSSADVSKRLVIRNRIIDRSSILPAHRSSYFSVQTSFHFSKAERVEERRETKDYIWPGSRSDFHPFEQPPASFFEKLASNSFNDTCEICIYAHPWRERSISISLFKVVVDSWSD